MHVTQNASSVHTRLDDLGVHTRQDVSGLQKLSTPLGRTVIYLFIV